VRSLALCFLPVAFICTPGQVKFGGYVDGYFQFDFGKPVTGDSVNGRGFDVAHNRANLTFAQIEASLAPKPLGFTLQLFGGRGPELIHLTEPGGRHKYRWVRKAYGTYVSAGRSPVTLDFGKFDTWIGYEGIDNRFQDEYGRSFNWTYSEPTYETGLRASAKLAGKLSGSVYLVQGWNEVQDGNHGKTFGLTLSYVSDAKTTLTLQNHSGDEGSLRSNDAGSFGGIGFPNAGISKVHLIDLILVHQATGATRVAFNIDYASSADAPNNGHWNGEVLYVRHQLKPAYCLAGRIERFEDTDGLRTGSRVKLYSLTASYDYAVSDHLTGILELRRDIADQPFFNSSNGLKSNRTTATLAAMVKF